MEERNDEIIGENFIVESPEIYGQTRSTENLLNGRSEWDVRHEMWN